MKKLLIALSILLLIGVAGLIGSKYVLAPTAETVAIGSTYIPVEVVFSDISMQKGLSGRTSLEENSGMLFMFIEPAIHRFWMPDMHFPIDIIWIDRGQVLDISANVSNDFDPQNPKYYSPKEKVRYVLEVNAGFAEKHNIKIGDPVLLP